MNGRPPLARLLASLVAALAVGVLAASVARLPATEPVAATYRLIVRIAPGGAEVERAALGAMAQRQGLAALHSRRLLPGLHAIRVRSHGEPLSDLITRLRADGALLSVEPDGRRRVAVAPNDPLYAPSADSANGQWYLMAPSAAAPSAIDAIDAWGISGGSAGIVIADIDTGVRYEHPDLLAVAAAGRLLPGRTFISDLYTANTGGPTDSVDAEDPGDWLTQAELTQWSVLEPGQWNTEDCPNSSVGDSSWHGTRVAGILGALTNNGVGIAGATQTGWILPVRALGVCGGADSDIETAMLWAAGLAVSDEAGNPVPLNPYPANVINLSLGGPTPCPASYVPVIQTLAARGVLIVASAGNEGGPVDAPANCAGVIAVAGLRQVGTKVGYSNLGPEVALAAPAGNCVNTSGPCLYGIDTTSNGGLTSPGASEYTNDLLPNVGTSFAAPLVSATAALMLAVNANLPSASVLARLQSGTNAFTASSGTAPACTTPSTATDSHGRFTDTSQALECVCQTGVCGAGMLDTYAAVAAAARPLVALALPASVTAGQTVTLTAIAQAACLGGAPGAIASYQWSGSSVLSATGAQATLVVPSGSAQNQVTLLVTDAAGNTDTEAITLSADALTTSAPSAIGASPACAAARSSASLPPTVALTPATALAQAGVARTVTFTATGSVARWRVNGIEGGNATVGTVSGGVYTPPSMIPSIAAAAPNAPIVTVSAEDSAGDALGEASVALSAVSPSVVTLAPAATQAFTATVNATAPTATTVWAVNGITGGNSSVGTISTAGLYTAPSTPTAVTVTATSALDAHSVASAEVTIQAPPKSGGGGGALGSEVVLLAIWALRRRARA